MERVNIKYLIRIFGIIFVAVVIFSCSTNKTIQYPDLIVAPISMQGFKNVPLGTFQTVIHPVYTKVQGTVIANSVNQRIVSTLLGGMVTELKVGVGDWVRKGAVLAILKDLDYITLQENYLIENNKLNLMKKELARQGELTVEQASSIKLLEKSQSEYFNQETRVRSLYKQLNTLGINPKYLTVDNISPHLVIFSPQEGTIIDCTAILGQYVLKGADLFIIGDTANMRIEFKVPTKALSNLKMNQILVCTSATHNSFKAKVVQQPTLSHENSIEEIVLAQPDVFLKPGTPCQTELTIESDTNYLIYSSAIIEKDNQKFIYTFNNDTLKKTKISTIATKDSLTEIKGCGMHYLHLQYVKSGLKELMNEIKPRYTAKDPILDNY